MGKAIQSAQDITDWMVRMRCAVIDNVDAADIAAITRGIVERAKQGDIKAADFVFRYLVGDPNQRRGPQYPELPEGRSERDPSRLQIEQAAKQIRINNGHKRDGE